MSLSTPPQEGTLYQVRIVMTLEGGQTVMTEGPSFKDPEMAQEAYTELVGKLGWLGDLKLGESEWTGMDFLDLLGVATLSACITPRTPIDSNRIRVVSQVN